MSQREIRRYEICNMLEEIYSELSDNLPTEKRRDKARFILAQAKEIEIEADDFHERSDLISDAAL